MSAAIEEQVIQSADGTEIGFRKLGSGRPIVLVHGGWNTSEQWLGVAEHLAESHTCYVMDRRGRASSSDGDDYSLDREIEDIKAVLDAAGPEAALLGHSSGAIYAIETAHRYPVSGLILYEPPLHFHGSEAEQFVDRIRECVDDGRPEDAATIFFREEAQVPDEQLAILRTTPDWNVIVDTAWTWVREWDAILEAELRVARYGDMQTPTLLLYGSQTQDHPSFATKELEKTLPNARKTRLEGQAHGANRMAPQLVAEQVTRFLN